MSAQAKVTWLSPTEGGRNTLPQDRRYVTISRFAEDKGKWPDGAWSVVLDFDVAPAGQGNPSWGSASFLMDTAPEELMRTGNRFELYEGLRKVADVELVDKE